MKIHEYNEMMAYLTRPATGDREKFAKGTPGTPSFDTRKILDKLPKGSEIDRIKIIEKTNVDPSELTKILKKYFDKNFDIKRSPNKSKGKIRVESTPELDKIAEAAYGKKFNELGETARTNINTGKITEESITSYRRLKELVPKWNKIAQEYYGKDYLDLDSGRRQRVQEQRGMINPTKIAEDKITDFTKKYKNKGKLPTKKEVIEGAKVSWSSVTNAEEKGIIKLDPSGQIESRMKPLNEDLLKLSKNENVKKALFKGDTKELLKLTKNILKLDDSSVIEARIGQLASAYSGDRNVPGINPDKKIEKIIPDLLQGLKNSRRERRKLADLKIGKSVGEKIGLASVRQYITKKYPNIPYNIDEPAGVTSSVRRGTTPYGVFSQLIDKDINQKAKKSYDSIKSKQEGIIQDALRSGDKDKINKAISDFNNKAQEHEKILNKNVGAGGKKIKLLRASLDKPENTIDNFNKLPEQYREAFKNNYKTRGYSFKVPKDIKTTYEIAKDVKDPQVVSKIIERATRGDARLYSKTIPGLETLINTVKSMPNDFKARRYWTLGLKSLGVAAVPLVAYDGYTAIREGLPADEVVARAMLGADKLLYRGKEILQLTPEEKEARKVVKQERLKELNEDQMMGFGFILGSEIDSDLSLEEAEAKWKEGQDRWSDFRERKDAARDSERAGIAKAIKDRVYGVPLEEITNQWYNQGGRVKDKDEE